MKRNRFLVMMSIAGLSLSAMFTACSSGRDAEDITNVVYNEEGKAGVKPEFVLSLPRKVVGGTRMEGGIVQYLGTSDQFRGIDHIRLIPFSDTPTKSSTKLADIMSLSSISVLEETEKKLNYKVYADQFVPVGTKNFLFYGKAVDKYVDQPLTSMNDKFTYGVLKSEGLTESEFTNAGSVKFSLEQINTSTEQQQNDPVGRAIIQLMSQLANVTVSGSGPDIAWSTTTHTVLAALYKNFIGTTVYSSNALAIMLDKIYFGLDHVESTDPAYNLANRIRSMIQDACIAGYEPMADTPVKLKSDYSGYPANIGLPDGAARCRWVASGQQANMFVDMTANYTLGFRVKPTDYCYPAALWYHVSTPIRTSANIESDNYSDQSSWENVISNIYTEGSNEVLTGTRSVALVKPVQYAVGRLDTSVKMESGDIYDGEGQAVDVGEGYTLKGILLGGQNGVNYAFESRGSENFCIYDRVMSASASDLTFTPGGLATKPNYTLALETQTNQVIFAALELVNNGQAFKGADGTIPAGGVFYMTVSLDPTTGYGYDEDTKNKIIMKDHNTILTVTIKKGNTFADRGVNGNPPDGVPDKYVFDANGVPIGVDATGHNDGTTDPYDIDGDGTADTIIPDPAHGGPGWDTDGDGEVDLPILPNPLTGKYPQSPTVPEGLGNATNGVPDLSSPGIELGTSVNLEWEQGLILDPSI